MIVQKRRDEYRDLARDVNMPPLDFGMYSEQEQRKFVIQCGSNKKPKLKSFRQMMGDLKAKAKLGSVESF